MNQKSQTTKRTKHELHWLKMYSLYTEFKEKFNREPEPNEIYEGENLGKWVSGQRRADGHNAWSKIRKEVLGNAGIEACGLETKTNRMIKLYLAYKEEYHREPIHNEIYHGENIGKWIRDQRKSARHGTLSPERKKQYQSAGIDLFVYVKEIQWNNACNLYIEFVQKFGRGPKSNEKYKNFYPGKWKKAQFDRLKTEKELVQQQYQTFLIQNGYTEDPMEVYWKKMYNLCLDFVKEYNRTPRYSDTYNGEPIGTWYGYQITLIEYNWLSDEQINLLKQLQFQEKKVEVVIYHPKGKHQERWEDACLLYIEYVQKYGCGPGKNEIYKNINLGKWVSSQKHYLKNNREFLQRRYQNLLLGNNFSEDPLEVYWEEMYALLYEYVQTNKRTPKDCEVYLDKPLGKWLEYQLKLMRYNSLSEDQYKRLSILTQKEHGRNNQ